jgi:hypothetical protein
MSSCALETLRSDVGAPSFNYEHLAPDIAEGLRTDAARLRHLITKTTAAMIEIGRDLISIKARLEHGQFADWVVREIGIGIRTAQGYMAISKLAEGKNEIISLLPPSTVRMLAARSAPPEVVEQVIARAGTGDIVPDTVVKDLISEKRADLRHQDRLKREAEHESRRPKAVRERKKNSASNTRLRGNGNAPKILHGLNPSSTAWHPTMSASSAKHSLGMFTKSFTV